jgi:excinuclease ABC subunit A
MLSLNQSDFIEIVGARVHNLKELCLSIPKGKLVVITGLSGSGKSSLAFSTIYSEGKRRYVESFSAYARRFMGNIDRPDVDKISGLSPVISIKQKNTNNNPRSTVGTVTEVYHFFRLLFYSIGEAYSKSGNKLGKQTVDDIVASILKNFINKKISVLAPLVKGRKGSYKGLIDKLIKSGFNKIRVNGTFYNLDASVKFDRYKTHDLDLLIDKLFIENDNLPLLKEAVDLAIKYGQGTIIVEVDGTNHYFSVALVDPETGISLKDPSPNTFSFNSPYGACKMCEGIGEILKINKDALIPDDNISISDGGILGIGSYKENALFHNIETILSYYASSIDSPIKTIPNFLLNYLFYGLPSEVASLLNIDEEFVGLAKYFEAKKGNELFIEHVECPECKGSRLAQLGLSFRIASNNIYELAQKNIIELNNWVKDLPTQLNDKQNTLAKTLLEEITKRLNFIIKMGLGYLSLGRAFNTLSGGEAQRIRLATQLSSDLIGILYILDEPSIGLHQKDNIVLIELLKQLRDIGNSVIVIEHDKDMMLEADYILEIGPGAGKNGGYLVNYGSVKSFLAKKSITAKYLTDELSIPVPAQIRNSTSKKLHLHGCTGNNLKNISLDIPLGKLVCITGVSGSGKSSLINKTLYPVVYNHFYNTNLKALDYESIDGLEHINKIISVDQVPISKSSRSTPVTYLNLFLDIRNIYASLPEAKIRGYGISHFSFNSKHGRCKSCEGLGVQNIEMDLLSLVKIKCEVCEGKRYSKEILNIKYKGKSISDVLEMTVDEAIVFFEKSFSMQARLKTLIDVGLGYIMLGQSSSTLSGGEAQRIKLANELGKKSNGKTLYILDEPTTGLHFQDIANFLKIINKIVDDGNTVIIIEHNLDIIKTADYIIDVGPGSGIEGGHIVAQGTPIEIVKNKNSSIGQFLKSYYSI